MTIDTPEPAAPEPAAPEPTTPPEESWPEMRARLSRLIMPGPGPEPAPPPEPELPPLAGPPFDWRAMAERLLLLALLGSATTAATIAEVRPAMLFLAGSGGGWLASRLFGRLRESWGLRVWARDNWASPRAPARYAAHAIGWSIYSPATAALSVAVLGAVLSGAASATLAALSGASLSESWAAFVAFVVSQIVYAAGRRPHEIAPRP